jgi:ABC-type amino acid transport system permease subunit
LPGPRQSLNISDTFFLSNRGLNMPAPTAAEGFWACFIALLLALVAVWFLARWARQRFEATGRGFPTLIASLVLIVGLPSLAALVFGDPFHWTVPELKGFNFRGGWVLIPELMALTLALTVYTAAFIAEIVRSGIKSVSHGQTEAARSLGLPAGKTLRLVIVPQALRVIIPPMTNQYLNLTKEEGMNWGMMRGIWSSVADLAVVQAQDVLGLGHEARMNTPATLGGNWCWRALPGAFTPELAQKLHDAMELYGRLPEEPAAEPGETEKSEDAEKAAEPKT